MITWDIMVGAGPVLATFLGITWTPMVFYIAMAIVHCISILLVFRIIQLDPEYNSFVSAALVAIVANVAAFFLKDFGVFGILASTSVLFALLATVTHFDMIKAIVAWAVMIALYWVVAWGVLPRTDDLTIEQIAGVSQVIMQGGLQTETFTQEDVETLSRGKKKD
ncbi:MAG: hypothetical protein ACNA8W_18930 [Bradymonadaceae bacterium]